MDQKVSEIIKEKIKNNQIEMKPKYYFWAAWVAAGIGVVASTVVGTFLINLTFFRLRTQRPFSHLMQGKGLDMFLTTFPWEYLALAVAALVLALLLLKKSDISYKKGMVFVVAALLLSVTFAAFAFDKTGLNERLSERPGTRRLYLREDDLRRQLMRKKVNENSTNAPLPAVKGAQQKRLFQKMK